MRTEGGMKKEIVKTDKVKKNNAKAMYWENKRIESLNISHVSALLHLSRTVRLLPDVLFSIYPTSIGQYWSQLSTHLPYWQQVFGASNSSRSEKEEKAVLVHIQSGLNPCLHSYDIKTNANFIIVVWEFCPLVPRPPVPLSNKAWMKSSCTMMERRRTNSLLKVINFPSSSTNREHGIYIR